ncbi:unnamed protein product [Closterium sp. NIES-65]|nr:unnamed protein product [Closterium sp. NIES-65]
MARAAVDMLRLGSNLSRRQGLTALAFSRPFSAAAVSPPGSSAKTDELQAASPSAKPRKIQCWKPDPVSGVWVPEDSFGYVESSTTETPQKRKRSFLGASMDERAWWSSLEELPEDRMQPTFK